MTPEQVKKIAHLARLEISPTDTSQYAENLTNIFALVDQMQQIDTQSIEPMAHPLDIQQRLRSDTITETDQHALFQSIAPAVESGLYLVPQVIE